MTASPREKRLGCSRTSKRNDPADESLRGSVRYGIHSTTASYWMELTTPSVMMMVRVEVVPGMM